MVGREGFASEVSALSKWEELGISGGGTASLNKCLGTKERSVLQIVALCGLGPGEWRVSGDSSFSVGVRSMGFLKTCKTLESLVKYIT